MDHANAFETDLRYNGHGAGLLVAYTLAKSMDTSSFIGEQINPVDPGATWAPSSFDIRHLFTSSYSLDLPINRIFRTTNGWTDGWMISGITRVSSGLPVTLYNDTDSSLLGTFGNGVNNHLLDTPDYKAGCDLQLNHNPKNGPAFNPDCFAIPDPGHLGNAPRRFFYGPGQFSTDLTVIKNVRLDAARALQFRLEMFNAFNQANFFGAGTVDGNIASPTFGEIVQADAPRLVQLGVKFTF